MWPSLEFFYWEPYEIKGYFGKHIQLYWECCVENIQCSWENIMPLISSQGKNNMNLPF